MQDKQTQKLSEFQAKILGISLILCRHPQTKLYLAVLQKTNQWWMPGGRVDAPQNFTQGAIRECKEQAGIDVQIKGILRFEHSFQRNFIRSKIVFYAEPIDLKQKPKSFKDQQSIRAEYMSLNRIKQLKKHWRGPQLHDWASYVEDGGTIFPLDLLLEEIKY